MFDFSKTRILTPKPIWQHHFNEYITAIAWSETNEDLAIATTEGAIFRYGKVLEPLQSANSLSIDCLSFSGHFLGAAGQSGQVWLWQLPNLEPILHLDLGDAWIDQWSWHNSKFAFNLGKTVQIWDADTQVLLKTFNFANSTVQGLAWHPKSEYLAVAGYQAVKIWHDDEPYVLPIDSAVTAIAWNKTGTCLVVATGDDLVLFLNYGQGSFNPSPFQLRGFTAKIKAIAWAEHSFALMSGSEITIWQPHPKPNNGWVAEVFEYHQAQVNAIGFQPHSQVLASGDSTGKIYLSKGERVLQELEVEGEITCLQWHPQGHKLAIATADGTVTQWQVVAKATGGKGFSR